MDGIWIVSATGKVHVVWHDVVKAPKDGGARLRRLLREHAGEVEPTAGTG